MIAQNDSSTIVKKLPIDGVYSMARTASGVFIALSISSSGVNIQNRTNAPAAMKATSLMMVRRVGLAGSEQHRERRHRQRDDQRDIADDRNRGEGLVFAQDRFQRRRHGLELQG